MGFNNGYDSGYSDCEAENRKRWEKEAVERYKAENPSGGSSGGGSSASVESPRVLTVNLIDETGVSPNMKDYIRNAVDLEVDDDARVTGNTTKGFIHKLPTESNDSSQYYSISLQTEKENNEPVPLTLYLTGGNVDVGDYDGMIMYDLRGVPDAYVNAADLGLSVGQTCLLNVPMLDKTFGMSMPYQMGFSLKTPGGDVVPGSSIPASYSSGCLLMARSDDYHGGLLNSNFALWLALLVTKTGADTWTAVDVTTTSTQDYLG